MATESALGTADLIASPLSPETTSSWHGGPRSRALDDPLLSIVIPALDEEESIGSTVQRCLDARDRICRVGQVRDVQVIVVSDGSTDRTAPIAQEIASREPSVSVVVFDKNRGYGAAIKEGFARSTGELVAFIDADGTCDPDYFGELCQALREQNAAVALGSRMGSGNDMPRLRRVGNTAYALLLGFLSGKAITDTASGMRVVRRDALPILYPLPDGLHFTPAMSARAIMSGQSIVEVPMAYSERVGESKLNVLRDGIRFLFAIRDAVLLYQPSRVFGRVAAACAILGVLWSSYPIEFYWRFNRLEEWMIYRLLLCGFLFTSAFGLLCAGVLGDRVLSLIDRDRRQTFFAALCERLLDRSRLTMFACLASAVSVVLVWPGLLEYAKSGRVSLHWSRPLVAVFLLQLAVSSVAFAVLQKIVDLWSGQLSYVKRTQGSTERL